MSEPAPRPTAEVVYRASLEIRGSVTYASFIVALVFVPPFAAFRLASGWRRGLAVSVGIGVGAYVAAFAAALALDQPFGPLCAIVLVLTAGAVALAGRR